VSPNPQSFLTHLQETGYHSRSNKHSNALALAIVDDLVTYCPAIRERAGRTELVFDLNFTLRAGTADWNVDLVLGPPEMGSEPSASEGTIVRRKPSTVQIAIELKAVMTEHRKAVKNRKRDLEAHHEHVHNYSDSAIAGGVLIVNAATTFKSPLRQSETAHRNPRALVQHCIDELRAIASRGGPTGYGLEAKCAIVLDMNNKDLSGTEYVTAAPAPPVGDPLHYDAFVRTICEHYTRRF
jgi:hypothetical protein